MRNPAGRIYLIAEDRIKEVVVSLGFTDVKVFPCPFGYEIITGDDGDISSLNTGLFSEFSHFYQPGGQDPPAVFVQALEAHQTTAVVAESCTGGLTGALITGVSGSSKVFWGGFITYANEAKERALGVPAEVLTRYGAVSAETVKAMVMGALRYSGAGIAVAISGIAGPGGGTREKPVGTVWIGIGSAGATPAAKKLFFRGSREDIRRKAAISGLLLGVSHLHGANLDTNRNWQYTY
ncbi:MAG: nicotinamide-nucleotide amidohydrolase family protein [Spirochaetales bacterium]|nr:nicotinamide-nucleotide amidohydrolase family protein [Spirochaetales bacterium]